MGPELSVIVLNWKASDTTIRCVQRIASWTRLHPTIWVVDNESTEVSAETLSHMCPTANLIRSSYNLGFAGGSNRGIVQALAVSDAPILLLNNDASIDQEHVLRLMSTLEAEKHVGIIGPLLFDCTERHKLLSAGGRNIALHVDSHVRRKDNRRPLYEVDYVPGTAVLIRAQVFRTVGTLDEDYFFGGELADLCIRARAHNYACAIDARARAFHDLDHSSVTREKLHIYYVFRNRFLFIKKFYNSLKVPLCIFWTMYGLVVSLKAQVQGKAIKARSIRLGLLDGWHGRFGGQNGRVLAMRPDVVPS